MASKMNRTLQETSAIPSIDTRGYRTNLCLLRCIKTFCKELKARALNLPSILLLLYVIPMSTVLTTVLINIAHDITSPPDISCVDPYPESGPATQSVAIIIENAMYLFIPLAGWIADTKIGRGKAIYISLWFGWIGTLLQSLSNCFQYSSCGVLASVGKYGWSSLALICLLISISFFQANALAYGIDQLMAAPSTKIRAFIYWYVWAMFAGGNPPVIITFLPILKYLIGTITISTITFALFTLSLCLHFHFHYRFEDMAINNPYRTVYNVVKYAFQNKYPKNRSAFTYWENEVPKRIDFAKDKYGGPYAHEEVENVKTFFRILAVLAALSPFLIASDPFINSLKWNFINQFKDGDKGLNGNAPFTFWFIGDDMILFAVPLLQFVILPLFPKLEYFLINPLKGLGIAMICLILSIFSAFIIDTSGRLFTLGHNQEHIGCFISWTSGDPIVNISYWVLLLPSILAGAADTLSFLCIFEFLCSQAPFGMLGMLIGLFWFLRAIHIDISSAITLVFQYGYVIDGPSILSCMTWFSILLGLIAVIGLIVYVLVARWYVLRVRNDDLYLRTAVEDHFEHRLILEVEYMKT